MFDGCPQPATNAASPSERTTLFVFGVMRCYPTFTSTCWITFHIKPLRFHCSLLWVSPTAFVARAMSRYCPRFLGIQDVRQRRHEYLPISASNPVTGVESNALNFNRHSGMQDFIGVGTNEYGTHVESIDGNCVLGQILWRFGAIWSVGNAIGFVRPEVAEGLGQHSDVAESLYPISSIPPRYDETQREAVHHGKRLVIHGVGDHYFAIPCVVDRKGLHEVRHRRQRRRVKPIE